MTSVPSWFLVNLWLLPNPLSGGAPFFSRGPLMSHQPADSPRSTPSDEEAAESTPTETRRVQVVARWNRWVQVFDPSDESLTWVNLDETTFARI